MSVRVGEWIVAAERRESDYGIIVRCRARSIVTWLSEHRFRIFPEYACAELARNLIETGVRGVEVSELAGAIKQAIEEAGKGAA